MIRSATLAVLIAAVCSACVMAPNYRGGRTPVEQGGQRVASLETALADALIQIEKLKARDGGSALSAMPPDAQTGACYARMLLPPKFIDREATRVVKESSEKLEMQPAKTEWREEKVVVSEAYTQLKVVPATYKWLEEKTQVLPARVRQELVSEAEYETVTEKILSKPAESVWRPGRGAVEKIDEDSGEILHLVEVPAKYRRVERQVLKRPAVYRRVVESAVFETVKKRVIDKPEHTVEVKVPATTKTVRVQHVVEPAKVKRIKVPAVYERYSYREKIADETLVWRQILCKRDASEARIRNVQRALNERGFDAGYADGILGKRTRTAIHSFQQKKGLATGRLSVETLEALDVAAP